MSESSPHVTDDVPRATIPTDRLYWAHLPNDRTVRRTAQDFRFERVLPLSVDRLHTARTALPDGSLLMVGIEPDAMRAELAGRSDITPTTWYLIPDALPDYLREAGIQPASLDGLNLLHGLFEPAPRRQWRQWRMLVPLAALGLAAVLITVGALRRAAHDRAEAVAIRQATAALIDRVVPAQGDQAAVPASARLEMAVRRVDQAQDGNKRLTNIVDLGTNLDEIWQRWPSDLRVQIETVTANAERVILRGRTSSLSDAESLSRALDGSESGGAWRAQPVQVTQNTQGADFVITLTSLAGANGSASKRSVAAAPKPSEAKATKKSASKTPTLNALPKKKP